MNHKPGLDSIDHPVLFSFSPFLYFSLMNLPCSQWIFLFMICFSTGESLLFATFLDDLGLNILGAADGGLESELSCTRLSRLVLICAFLLANAWVSSVYLLLMCLVLGGLLLTLQGSWLRSVDSLKRAKPDPRFRNGLGSLLCITSDPAIWSSFWSCFWKLAFLFRNVIFPKLSLRAFLFPCSFCWTWSHSLSAVSSYSMLDTKSSSVSPVSPVSGRSWRERANSLRCCSCILISVDACQS